MKMSVSRDELEAMERRIKEHFPSKKELQGMEKRMEAFILNEFASVRTAIMRMDATTAKRLHLKKLGREIKGWINARKKK